MRPGSALPSLSREIWWRGDRPWGLLSRDPADLRLADTAQSGGRWSHSSALSSFACRSVPRPPQSCCPLSPGLPAPLSAAASALQPRYEGRPAPRGTPGRHVRPGNARVLPPPGSSWTSGPPTPRPGSCPDRRRSVWKAWEKGRAGPGFPRESALLVGTESQALDPEANCIICNFALL